MRARVGSQPDGGARWPGVDRVTARSIELLARGRVSGLALVLFVLSFGTSVIPDHDVREVVIDLAFTVMLVFAVRSLHRSFRLVAVVLALPAVVGHWTLHLPAPPFPKPAVFAASLVFLSFLTLVMLHEVLREQRVTTDTLVGAVCAYVLLGVTWGAAYALIAITSPHAFEISDTLASAAHWAPPHSPLTPLLQYYSFATLSTVGYGDMSPISAAARSLSVLESLVGPLYLAILISRLVGMHVARSGGDR
jgi:voltage-gated potassium channel